MFSELGIKLPTSTVNDWMHATANVLYPLYESQREAVMAGSYVRIDEVPWNIADRKGQASRKGYAWQFRDVSPHSRGTFFYYHKGSRGGEIPRTQLRGYRGVIQNDGYKVYNEFENVPGITVLACMAHIRRKFVDAQSRTRWLRKPSNISPHYILLRKTSRPPALPRMKSVRNANGLPCPYSTASRLG